MSSSTFGYSVTFDCELQSLVKSILHRDLNFIGCGQRKHKEGNFTGRSDINKVSKLPEMPEVFF